MMLLLVKGACRAGPPIYVLWSIYEWTRVDWRIAVVFAALTLNYVLVFLLTWTAPGLMNGPWRVRPWQTLVLLVNAIALPVMFYRVYGRLPLIFIATAVLCVASLYVGAAIFLYLNDKLPRSLLNPQGPAGTTPLAASASSASPRSAAATTLSE